MEEKKSIKDFILLKNFRISNRRRILFLIKIILTIFLGYVYFSSKFSFDTLFSQLILLIFAYLVISDLTYLIQTLMLSIYRKKNKLKEDFRDNFTLGLDKLFAILNSFLYLIFLMVYFVVDFVSFLTTLGLFSVATAWLFKEKFSNILEGLSLLFSSDIRIGEYINVDNYTGRVMDINLSNTTLKTDAGDTVYVPNSIIMNSTIVNYSKGNVKKVNYEFSISSKHFNKISKIEKYLSNRVSKEFGDITNNDSTRLYLNNITETSVDMNVEVLVTKYNLGVYTEVRKFIAKSIIKYLSSRNK